jgi:hypothetical protein
MISLLSNQIQGGLLLLGATPWGSGIKKNPSAQEKNSIVYFMLEFHYTKVCEQTIQ